MLKVLDAQKDVLSNPSSAKNLHETSGSFLNLSEGPLMAHRVVEMNSSCTEVPNSGACGASDPGAANLTAL